MFSALLSKLSPRRRRDVVSDPVAERAVRQASIRPVGKALDLLDLSEGPDTQADATWRRTIRGRVLVLFAVMGLWTAGIEARLVYLQVVSHEAYLARAERQHQGVVELPGTRGDIVDRNGRLLAYSVDTDGVVAYPVMITEPEKTVSELCGALGDCTSAERRTLLAKFSTDDQYAIVRKPRAVTLEQVARVTALNLAGVRAQAESQRWYPNREIGAHVLGFVGQEDKGLAGVESAFDSQIRGREGVLIVQKDGGQQFMSARVEQAPTAGVTLELTIDLNLQHFVEREVAQVVREFRANGATGIVMDPFTGEVLALANVPTFNPNDFGQYPQAFWRNRAVQDVYEPGSTFKIVTASAAIEEGVVRATDVIDTSPGYIKPSGRPRPIYDVHAYDSLTFEDVIVKSSNVGAVKVGQLVGAERMGRYIRRFGLGQILEPNLPGQSAGIVHPVASLDESSLASVSMGYQISVTALQMATVVSVIANGGVLMEPHVVKAFNRDGTREEIAPKQLRRVIRPETAATVRTFMEGVVERGTGTRARMEHYQVAAKSGTAAKAVPGGYSNTDYNASFVGFVPSQNPLYAIVVVVDTPRGGTYYGGSVAAPVFKRIAEAALRYAGAKPSLNPGRSVVVAADRPTMPLRRTNGVGISPVVAPAGGPALMPDLSGLSAREAIAVLTDLGLVTRATGSGLVSAQYPEAGEPIERGGLSVIRLTRRPVRVADDVGGSR